MDMVGTVTVMHTFTGPDGGTPRAALVQGADGQLYGSTVMGGAFGLGVLFRVDPASSPPPTSTLLRSTAITLFAQLLRNGQVNVTGTVTVKDANSAAVSGATVAATWTKPNGATQNQTASTDTSGNANFNTKSGRGTYTLTVTNITKTGYTFDPANSVLSRSITK